MARVDVVVPCYNYGQFLPACVESVLAQEGVDVRILIIDDCSPDDSADVGARLAAADPRIEFTRHTVNRGHIATYNEGLMEWAESDYCVLLSADDLLTPGSLARAVAVMEAHPQIGFVHGRFIPLEDGNAARQPSTIATACSYLVESGHQWIENICRACKNHIASPEVVVRTRLQRQLAGYRSDLPYTGDLEMWLRFASHGDVGILDADQAYYRRHGRNMSVNLASTSLKTLNQLWAAYDTGLRNDALPGDLRARGERLAREGIAHAALQDVYRLLQLGHSEDCEPLFRFASTLHPQARSWRLHSRLKWRLRLGPVLWPLLRRVAGKSVA